MTALNMPVLEAFRRTGIITTSRQLPQDHAAVKLLADDLSRDDLVPFNIQNVADYVADAAKQGRARDLLKPGQAIKPPFPMMFLEFVSKDGLDGVPVTTGLYVATYPVNPDTINMFFQDLKPEIPTWATDMVVIVTLSRRTTDRGVFGPLAVTSIPLAADGAWQEDSFFWSHPVSYPKEIPGDVAMEWDKNQKEWEGRAAYLTLFACSLCHVRNVRLVDEQPKLTRQERRRRERLGQPTISFKTIRIDPNRTTNVGPSRDGGSAHLLPLHIVRGHFRTYSENRPLFGKYAGTFWVPAHARGLADQGEIVHGYAVDAPKGD